MKIWKKKDRPALTIFAVIMAFSLLVGTAGMDGKAATFEEVNQSTVFLKQPGGSNTCTLYSATMLVRRAAMLNDNENWAELTADVIRSAAWVTGIGLKWSFQCSGINVGHSSFSGSSQDLITLLNAHPEGIIIYDRAKPHAILVTDYTEGIFYCADPAPGIGEGRIPISSASITVEGVDDIWYVSSPDLYLKDKQGNRISRETLHSGTDGIPTMAASATPKPSAVPKPTATRPSASPAAKAKVKAPKKVSGVKTKNVVKKSIKVSWKKISTAKGYEILYADNKKFQTFKYVYVNRKNHKLTGLTKRKSYYIKVRAYKSDKNGLLYGKWSGVKKVKVKK